MRKIMYGVMLMYGFSCKNPKATTKPTLMDITESVYATVSVSPEVLYAPHAKRSGIIEEIWVEKGDTVQKGDLLFVISTAEEDKQLVDAYLDLAQAKANFTGKENLLKNLKLEQGIVRQQLLLDSVNFKRQERLWSQNIGSKIELDKAKITYESTLTKYEALQEQYGQTERNLENSYQKALNRVARERTFLNEFSVRSEIEGRVYDIFKEAGELIGPQEPFGEIGSASRFNIDMEVDEFDIVNVSVGDTAIISLDAYPGETFEATITRIFPKKDKATQSFSVEGKFIHTPPQLYNGLSGEANIIVAKRKNILTIPTEYLTSNGSVLTPDGEIRVNLGVKNLEFVEICAGIDSSTVILKPKP